MLIHLYNLPFESDNQIIQKKYYVTSSYEVDNNEQKAKADAE